MGKNKLRMEFAEAMLAAGDNDAILSACAGFGSLCQAEMDLARKRMNPRCKEKRFREMLHDRVVARFIETRLRTCGEIDKKINLALAHLSDFRRSPHLLAGLGFGLSDLEKRHRYRMAEQARAREAAALFRDRETYRTEIAPLSMAKRLDAILKTEKTWSKRKDILQEDGVTWEMVEERRVKLHAQAEASRARKAQAKSERIEAVQSMASQMDLSLFKVTAGTRSDPKRPITLTADWSEWLDHRPAPIRRIMARALAGCFPGFFPSYGKPNVLEGSAEAFLRLAEAREEIEARIKDILALTPGSVEHLNRPDAVSVAGLTPAAFDDAVKRKVIRVASTETFEKWGRTLTAKRFEARHILDFAETEAARRFIAARETRIANRRKSGSAKAIETRARRLALKEDIRLQDRRQASQAARAQGSLQAALHFELFTWAQRASRLAKTTAAAASEAYELKDEALLCLVEAGAAFVTFVDAREPRLISKCRHHAGDWYPARTLIECPNCRIEESHHYSLYAISLANMPEAGTLHLPYPLGVSAGLPDFTELPAANHGRDVAYGRELDADETAIFNIATIRKEVMRLVGILEREDEDCAFSEKKSTL